jgi:REP element-mobilizing transposase RayT
MSRKFRNKYRIETTRLQNWDYGWSGAYFVTICTHNRICYFGVVNNGIIQLSPMGAVANVLWCEIKNHNRNVALDAFVVMPNHIHGIIILNHQQDSNENIDGINDNINNDNINNDDTNNDDINNDNINVETRHALSLQPGQRRFQNQGKNTLSSIVGSYKSAVTKHAHRLKYDFAWQSRFHDHIIRDERSYENIRNYIINNPANWVGDKFFSE